MARPNPAMLSLATLPLPGRLCSHHRSGKSDGTSEGMQMDELLDRIKDLGLDDGKAEEVVRAVRSFLEEKLPEPMAARLDDILSGDSESMSSLLDKLPGDEIAKGVGGKLKGLLGD